MLRIRTFIILMITSVVLLMNIQVSAQIKEEDFFNFLKPTSYIDSNNPDINNKVLELTRNCSSVEEKARAIYKYVRDSYNDNVFESYTASEILEKGGNSCGQRSILLTALCRAANIPSRLHLQYVIIRNFKFTNGEVKDCAFIHGITGIYLNNNWYLYDPVGNKDKWIIWTQNEKRAREMPVKFYPDRDCLFKTDQKILIQTLPIYFAQNVEERNRFIDLIYKREIGVFMINKRK